MRAVCDGTRGAGKSRPAQLGSHMALMDFINSVRKMQIKTTLLLNKSRFFGQNERRKWKFRI